LEQRAADGSGDMIKKRKAGIVMLSLSFLDSLFNICINIVSLGISRADSNYATNE